MPQIAFSIWKDTFWTFKVRHFNQQKRRLSSVMYGSWDGTRQAVSWMHRRNCKLCQIHSLKWTCFWSCEATTCLGSEPPRWIAVVICQPHEEIPRAEEDAKLIAGVLGYVGRGCLAVCILFCLKFDLRSLNFFMSFGTRLNSSC